MSRHSGKWPCKCAWAQSAIGVLLQMEQEPWLLEELWCANCALVIHASCQISHKPVFFQNSSKHTNGSMLYPRRFQQWKPLWRTSSHPMAMTWLTWRWSTLMPWLPTYLAKLAYQLRKTKLASFGNTIKKSNLPSWKHLMELMPTYQLAYMVTVLVHGNKPTCPRKSCWHFYQPPLVETQIFSAQPFPFVFNRGRLVLWAKNNQCDLQADYLESQSRIFRPMAIERTWWWNSDWVTGWPTTHTRWETLCADRTLWWLEFFQVGSGFSFLLDSREKRSSLLPLCCVRQRKPKPTLLPCGWKCMVLGYWI